MSQARGDGTPAPGGRQTSGPPAQPRDRSRLNPPRRRAHKKTADGKADAAVFGSGVSPAGQAGLTSGRPTEEVLRVVTRSVATIAAVFTPIAAVLAPVHAVLRPIAAVLGTVANIFTPVEAVLDPIQRPALVSTVPDILAAVEAVLPAVKFVLSAVPPVLGPVADILTPIEAVLEAIEPAATIAGGSTLFPPLTDGLTPLLGGHFLQGSPTLFHLSPTLGDSGLTLLGRHVAELAAKSRSAFAGPTLAPFRHPLSQRLTPLLGRHVAELLSPPPDPLHVGVEHLDLLGREQRPHRVALIGELGAGIVERLNLLTDGLQGLGVAALTGLADLVTQALNGVGVGLTPLADLLLEVAAQVLEILPLLG